VIEGAVDVTIRNSTIGPCVGAIGTDNGKAIYALNADRVTITANSFVEAGRNAVQFDKVQTGLIANNVVRYPQGTTNAEDLISVYASHDVEVAFNDLSGGGPSNSGSCLMLGDAGGSDQYVHDNICIYPGQVGIGVAGGTFITVVDNVVKSQSYPWSNVGIYVWNQYATPCHDVTVSGNTIEWFNSSGQRNDFWNGGGC